MTKNIKTFIRCNENDYHNFYLKSDILPQMLLSAPDLSWDAMLTMTKVEVELLADPDMYIFYEKSMSGGVSYISNRHSKANNKYLKFHDLKQKSRHNIYLGANNLYGYATSKSLPTSGFKWIDPKEFDFNKYTSNSSNVDGFWKLILNIL